MYTDESIMTYQDFNTIEQKINTLTNEIASYGYTISSYTPKTWVKKDFLLYTDLNNIEDGIKALGKSYFRPYGWENTKTWQAGEGFSYRDVNRWIIDLNLIEERLNEESNELLPSDTLYPSDTLLPH